MNYSCFYCQSRLFNRTCLNHNNLTITYYENLDWHSFNKFPLYAISYKKEYSNIRIITYYSDNIGQCSIDKLKKYLWVPINNLQNFWTNNKSPEEILIKLNRLALFS